MVGMRGSRLKQRKAFNRTSSDLRSGPNIISSRKSGVIPVKQNIDGAAKNLRRCEKREEVEKNSF